MVTCTNCQTSNSLDSLFCKKCGKDLPADVLADAKAELGRAVAQGFVLFNEGKIEEASLMADMGVKEDPTLSTAISLKGMCHERRGQLADALACYEEVLALCPDSALDRIKVTQLRNHISMQAAGPSDPPPPNRRLALLMGFAAILFVIAVFSGAAMLWNHDQALRVADKEPLSTSAAGFTNTALPPMPAMKAKAAVGVQGAPPQTDAARAPQGDSVTANNQSDTSLQPIRPMTGDSTPANVPPATKVVPDDSAPADNAVPTAKATPAASVAGSDDPKPLAQGGASGPVELAANDPGFIEITVSKPATKTHGGSDTTGDADSGVALAKVAANEFQLKRYDAAAKAYEKLLTSGGNPATLNQRLGQCYENLGRNQDALTAYQRAADALSSAIAAGHGNLTSEKTALNSCKAAIQLLGGGQ